jgi:hypothetical protein
VPIGASVSGTLTRIAAGGSSALGTLSVIGYATAPALGTLSVDRTLFLAFYSRVRLCRPDVFVAGELMPNLVDTVEVDDSLDDPISYATFTLSDKRVAFFDAATLSNGERAVEIDFWAGPPGGVLPWMAFVGDTETSTNSMPYRPRGQFRAVSKSARWANLLGCLNLPALSGLRRGAIIVAYAESAGVAIANAGQVAGLGGVTTKKVDIAGKTPFQVIQELGEIDGLLARATTDGAGLEVISEDHLLDGAPIFSFDESNYFDVTETTPDRPVTNWVLSTTVITTDPTSPAVSIGSGGGATVVPSSGGGGGGVSAPAALPVLLSSEGGSPTITGTRDGTNTTFATSVNSSASRLSMVFVDGSPDFNATWTGTTLTPSTPPLTSIRLLYWS